MPVISGSTVSDILSHRAIVTGAGIDYQRHCKLEFGAYVQTHEDHNNTMVTRTVGALALRPTGNAQGETKYNALPYLMFLKQKRTGKIKGRGCADGRKQHETMSKEEVSSPTVAIESVMISCTIDAHEERDVATADIPGAFMQADMEGTVYLRIDGAMAELLIRLDPTLYSQYVEEKNGKKVLYLLLKKALYGTLQAALLFYNKLTTWLSHGDLK